ncbi:MAG: hypothetical protein HZA80_02760 [Candidatus Taylorbacteria bacterium]|nr:hypothetical protein [Candidatus Taylorbacteria bacterium]
MEKRTFHDVVPPTERSVRRIPIAGRQATIRPTSQPAQDTFTPPTYQERPSRERHFSPLTESKPRNHKKLTIGALILVGGIALVAVLSALLGTVEVRVTPKHAEVKINDVYTATASGSTPGLRYIIATSTAIVSEVVPATKGGIVQTKAKGKVLITNTSSTVPQKLVATTRLQALDGTIYRLDTAVTVPAATNSGDKLIPGTITASVTADQYGDSYNLRLSDGPFTFTFPGFKGSKKFDVFTAKAVTDITGGYFGTKNIISPTVAQEATARLQKKLSETLVAQSKAYASSTYVMYDTGYALEIERLVDISKGTNSSEIRYSGTIYVPMFEPKNLVAHIAKTESERIGGAANIRIEGLQELAFTARDLKVTTLKKREPFSFALRGNIKLTGNVAVDALRENLKGLSLSESNAIFAKYSTIANADVVTIPSWIRWFPKSDSRIKISVQEP